jgi:hypothetical protein
LNFGVSFYKEGNVLTTETYTVPFSAKILNDSVQVSRRFNFVMLDPKRYELSLHSEDSEASQGKAVFNFGDTVNYG